MINRVRVQNELSRRYDEVMRLAEKKIHDDKQAERFISAIAHYVNYAKKNKLTNKAILQLTADKDFMRKDKELCSKADAIIAEMKADRDRLVEIARTHDIDPDAYEFTVGAGEITGEKEFSFYLSHLNEYLNLPSDKQGTGELPGNILYLTQLVHEIVAKAGETEELTAIKTKHLKHRGAFEQELKLHGVHMDYLRYEDYKHLEMAWKEVYQQAVGDELLLFHLQYMHLFERGVSYSGSQQYEADNFIDDYVTHLNRFHNHLIDQIENVPVREEFATWFVEHFGPTFVSVLIIFGLYGLLYWITDGAVSVDEVKGWIGR